jgi:hypothetical protein
MAVNFVDMQSFSIIQKSLARASLWLVEKGGAGMRRPYLVSGRAIYNMGRTDGMKHTEHAKINRSSMEQSKSQGSR